MKILRIKLKESLSLNFFGLFQYIPQRRFELDT